MAVRHSPERGWISNHNKSEASPPRRSGGNRADPEASPVPPRSQNATGLPGCRQHGCHFVRGGDRSGSTERGVCSRDRGQPYENRTGVYASFCSDLHPQRQGARVCEPENHPTVARLRSPSCIFHVTIRSNARHQHGQPAATALQPKRNMDHTRTAPWSTQDERQPGDTAPTTLTHFLTQCQETLHVVPVHHISAYGGGFLKFVRIWKQSHPFAFGETEKYIYTTVGPLKQRLSTFHDNHPVKL